jgi:hypothetical protein
MSIWWAVIQALLILVALTVTGAWLYLVSLIIREVWEGPRRAIEDFYEQEAKLLAIESEQWMGRRRAVSRDPRIA